MKRIFNAVIVFILTLLLPVTASANVPGAVPNTGDVAIIVSVVLVVIAIALFVFIKRRR